MPVDGVVGGQSPLIHSTLDQMVSHQLQGVAAGNRGRVVTDEGHPIAYGVVTPGVAATVKPASALVDVPVGAYHEAARGGGAVPSQRVNRSPF